MLSKPNPRSLRTPTFSPQHPEHNDKNRTKPKRRRSWGWVFLFGILLIAGVIALAPNIISLTGLKDSLIRRGLAGYPMDLKVHRLHLSWLSPIVAEGIELIDANGRTLATVGAIQTEQNLFDLAFDWHNVGTIRVDEPIIFVAMDHSTSNWEEFIAALPASESSSPTYVNVAVDVTRGKIEIKDLVNQRVCLINDLNARALVPGDPLAGHTAELECRVDLGNKRSGGLQGELTWQADESAPDSAFSRGEILLRSKDLPLACTEIGLRRFLPGTSADGLASCDAKLTWQSGGEVLTAAIREFQAVDLLLRCPVYLGPDAVEADSMVAAGEFTMANGKYDFSKLAIKSDAFSLNANGQLTFDSDPSQPAWRHYLGQDFDVRAQIDVAQLAKMLPATLHLREDTRISSGTVNLAVTSALENGTRRWLGKLDTDQLTAEANGRAIRWNQPVRLAISAQETDQGLNLQEFICAASFVDLKGHGGLDEGAVVATVDLDQLVRELGQFVDFQGIKMAGQLAADIRWQQRPGVPMRAEAAASVENFQLAAGQLKPWREDKLVVKASGIGVAGLSGLDRIDEASVQVESGKDRLIVRLLEPVTELAAEAPWKASVQMVGNLNSWVARAQPFLSLANWDISGSIDLQSEVAHIGRQYDLPNLRLQFDQLQIRGPGLALSEPKTHLEADLTWVEASRELIARSLTVASSTVAIRGEDILVRTGDGGLAVSGDAGFRGEIGRLMNWFVDPREPRTTKITGMATGQLRITHESGVSLAQLTSDVTDLTVATRPTLAGGTRTASETGWTPAWEEKRLVLSGTAKHDAARSQIELSQFEVASKALRANTSGTIADVTGVCDLDLAGKIEYDWQQVSALLRPYTGSLLRIEGEENREFRVQGPLFAAGSPARPSVRSGSNLKSVSASKTPSPTEIVPVDLLAYSRLGWKSANYSGFEIGPGELDARLEKGILNLGPLDVEVSGGRVHLAPQILLNSSPPIITASPGKVADQVEITPEMCQTWLQYLAPVMAGATAAEGQFSIDLTEANIPASNPLAGTIRGTLTIHDARIGPGPLAREMVWVAQQIKSISQRKPFDPNLKTEDEWLELPGQKIEFEVAKGRVTNRGIAFHIKDVDIRTHGSVGLDQSMSLVAELPIKDEWVAKERFLSALQGQSLQIPVTGTVSKPKVDSRALVDLSKQAVTGAATRMLENELNRGLDRLLRPKK